MQLQHEAEYTGEKDPFRAFWAGFDAAIELAFKAIRETLKDSEVERVAAPKKEREITSASYIRAQSKLDQDVKAWVGRG